MQLYLDSYGAYLSVRNGMFCVRTRAGMERNFAVRLVDVLLLTKGTAMSTDAALLAVEQQIPVLLINADTHYPLGQISGGSPGSIATVRKNQALFARQGPGFEWVARCIAQKIERQKTLLLQLCEQAAAPPSFVADVPLATKTMTYLQRSFTDWTAPTPWNQELADKSAEQFRGQEGSVARLYFQQISKYLGQRLDFKGRGKRPATDPFNALLNYLYGMLYTTVHLALLKSGLDPYMGILHADQWGDRPTLVYDAIEPYRPWADQVALQLVDAGAIDSTLFEPAEDAPTGLWLSGTGKGMVIDAMLAFLSATSAFQGRNVRRSAQIELEAQQLAVQFREMEL